ncbi:alpha/beta-hydrolase family protein [Streptomyces zaomyceticus]|uniref:alpha/beta-hydrolase family protein n=1 Tax=Streptomyces zaomyceticus TaxID=68286 RepID=UPI00386D9861
MQNASDPVVWWSPDLLLSRPSWLDEPLGPDITPRSPGSPSSPSGRPPSTWPSRTGSTPLTATGYGAGAVDGRAAVLPPPGWTAADTTRLRAFIGRRPAAY